MTKIGGFGLKSGGLMVLWGSIFTPRWGVGGSPVSTLVQSRISWPGLDFWCFLQIFRLFPDFRFLKNRFSYSDFLSRSVNELESFQTNFKNQEVNSDSATILWHLRSVEENLIDWRKQTKESREGEKKKKGEKREEGRKKEGEKKERRRGLYVIGRQEKWLNTATDEGAQRLRSERPV